jgi:hypothetical protein
MIVDNFYVVSISSAPYEADAPLIVDADAVLPVAVVFQSVKPVARRHPQI